MNRVNIFKSKEASYRWCIITDDVTRHIISDEGLSDFSLNTRSVLQEQDTQDFWATATKEPSDILAKTEETTITLSIDSVLIQ